MRALTIGPKTVSGVVLAAAIAASGCGGTGPSDGDVEAAIARFEAKHRPWKARMDEQMRDSLGGLNRGNLQSAQAGIRAQEGMRRQANEELGSFVRGEPILMALGRCLVARQRGERGEAPSFERVNWSSLGMPTELRALAAEAKLMATVEPSARTSGCSWPEGL